MYDGDLTPTPLSYSKNTKKRRLLIAALLLLFVLSLIAMGVFYKTDSASKPLVSDSNATQPHSSAEPTDTSAEKSATDTSTKTAKKDSTPTNTPATGSSTEHVTSTTPDSDNSRTPSDNSTGSGGGSSSATSTLHYAVNIGSQQSLALSMGFNLFDVGGSTKNPSGVNTIINGLPSGAKALVWVGNLDNTDCTPAFSYGQFTAQVDALKNNPRVFGYYLSDEPHPSVCPSAASDIKSRADYIHVNAPSQKSFIVILDGSNMCGSNLGCEYTALNPAHTNVDYFGIDPYPCHYAADGVTAVPCDNSQITARVNSAISSGIPASAIVPTFQVFGQAGRTDGKSIYYRMPTSTELSSMLSAWANLVPQPAFDYAYSFGVQCSSSCPAPQAIANHPEIQAIIEAHNN